MNRLFSSLRFLFILSVFALPFAACSDDDGDGGGDGIEGRWQATLIENSNCNDPEDEVVLDLSTDNCLDFLGTEVCFDIVYEFKGDGTYEFTTTTETTFMGQTSTETDVEMGTYTTDGNSITICDPDDDCSMGTFSISGNTLTLTYQDDPDTGCDGELIGERI